MSVGAGDLSLTGGAVWAGRSRNRNQPEPSNCSMTCRQRGGCEYCPSVSTGASGHHCWLRGHQAGFGEHQAMAFGVAQVFGDGNLGLRVGAAIRSRWQGRRRMAHRRQCGAAVIELVTIKWRRVSVSATRCHIRRTKHARAAHQRDIGGACVQRSQQDAFLADDLAWPLRDYGGSGRSAPVPGMAFSRDGFARGCGPRAFWPSRQLAVSPARWCTSRARCGDSTVARFSVRRYRTLPIAQATPCPQACRRNRSNGNDGNAPARASRSRPE